MDYEKRKVVICKKSLQDKSVHFLYKTKAGKKLLKLLVKPCVSNAVGVFMNSVLSVPLIKPFIKNNHIDMNQYKKKRFKSYNEFFTRQIKDGKRPFSHNPIAVCSPCDSKLSVHRIKNDARFCIKGTHYTMESLVKDKEIAEYYKGGYLLVFRLSVDDYHRYAYIDDGVQTGSKTLKGVYHTVHPAAGEVCPVYKENTREYSILKSKNFGNILMMEVGAMLVGRILNYRGKGNVKRGQEKGRFEYGGSTVILAFAKDEISIDAGILKNSANGYETRVFMGERIGCKN